MFDEVVKTCFKENIFIYILLGLGVVGILIKILIACKYRGLIKAVNHMGTTNHKIIKSLRSKFETNYSINLGVNNVDVFVDKYVYGQKFCGIYLYTWENISGQIILISMLVSSITAIAGLLYKCGKDNILSTFLVGILISALLIVVDHSINLPVKKYVVRLNIRDYLENFLAVKLEYNRARTLGQQSDKLVHLVENQESRKSASTSMLQKDSEKLCEIDKKENEIINDILDEYIIS